MSARCAGLASPLPDPPLSVVLLGSAAAGRPALVVGVVVGVEVGLLVLVLDLSVLVLRTVVFHNSLHFQKAFCISSYKSESP